MVAGWRCRRAEGGQENAKLTSNALARPNQCSVSFLLLKRTTACVGLGVRRLLWVEVAYFYISRNCIPLLLMAACRDLCGEFQDRGPYHWKVPRRYQWREPGFLPADPRSEHNKSK